MRSNADKATTGRRGRRLGRGGRDRAWAFTLIELLTIIIILGLLIAMASPSILTARKLFKVRESRGRIHQIAGGCEMFKMDCQYYPPSTASALSDQTPGWEAWESINDWAGGIGAAQGRHILVQCLVGYLGVEVDLENGTGFRKAQRGKVYGPYNGAERTEKRKIDNRPFAFVDAFANEIYYYCYNNAGTEEYATSHNSNGPALPAYAQDANGIVYRRDFLLMTPGPDKAWKDVGDNNPRNDDIANFIFRINATAQP